jgi:hypothetical protein
MTLSVFEGEDEDEDGETPRKVVELPPLPLLGTSHDLRCMAETADAMRPEWKDYFERLADAYDARG